jgi:SAM-dependent methyltransferase
MVLAEGGVMVYGPTQSNPVGGDHGDLLAALAAFLLPDSYLELGCADRVTFEKVAPHCRMAVGVDRFAVPFASGNRVIECSDTVEYMKKCAPASFELIFLDSSHEYEATLRELAEIERVIVPNGVLAMHDTYPPNEAQAVSGYCGDVWRAAAFILWGRKDWEAMTLPAQYGLTLARRMPKGGHLAWKV